MRAIVKEEVAAALLVVREDLQTEITQLSDRVDEVQVTASQADRQASSLQVVTSAMLKCGQAGLLPVGGTRCIPAQVPAKAPQGRSCSDLLAQGGECGGHAPVARFLSTWRHVAIAYGIIPAVALSLQHTPSALSSLIFPICLRACACSAHSHKGWRVQHRWIGRQSSGDIL